MKFSILPFRKLAVALLALSPGLAAAQVNVFEDLNGDWHTPANWSLGVPVAGQQVTIGNNANNNTATISVADAISGQANIGSGSGNFGSVVVEDSRTWNAGIVYVGLGGGTGNLLIQDGAEVVSSNFVRIGVNPSSTGSVTVTGTGSLLSVSTNTLRVGSTGTGELIVTDGGLVLVNNLGIASQSGSSGTATVGGGANSSIVQSTATVSVGGSGVGSLEILENGLVQGSSISGGTVAGSQLIFSGGELRIAGGVGGTAGNQLTFNDQVSDSLINVVNSGATVTFSGDGSGDGGFVKTGAGTLVMNGSVAHSGPTLVSQGKLLVNGSFDNSDVTVASGAILGGTGFIGGDVFVQAGGIRAPGLSPGGMSGTNEFWAGGGIYNWEINAPETTIGLPGNDPGWDLISLSGQLTISADALNPFIINMFTLTPGNTPGLMDGFFNVLEQQWTIVSTTGGIIGFDEDFFVLNTAGFLNPVFDGIFSLGLSDDGNDLIIFYSGIPEPSRAMLIALALGLVFTRRRR